MLLGKQIKLETGLSEADRTPVVKILNTLLADEYVIDFLGIIQKLLIFLLLLLEMRSQAYIDSYLTYWIVRA